jgi:hypothetical protein
MGYFEADRLGLSGPARPFKDLKADSIPDQPSRETGYLSEHVVPWGVQIPANFGATGLKWKFFKHPHQTPD